MRERSKYFGSIEGVRKMELKNGLAIGFSMGAKNIDEAAEYFIMHSFIESPKKSLTKFKVDYERYKSGKLKIDKNKIFDAALQMRKAKGHFE